jgi:hypothetical protein
MDSEQTSQSSKNKSLISVEEKGFLDNYKYTFDPRLSFDLLELHTTYLQNFSNFVDHYHVWESNLAKFVVPQVYNFPEFISWCVACYVPTKRIIVAKDDSVLCSIDVQSILDMLKLSADSDVEELNITKLNNQYLTLNSQDRITLLQHIYAEI